MKNIKSLVEIDCVFDIKNINKIFSSERTYIPLHCDKMINDRDTQMYGYLIKDNVWDECRNHIIDCECVPDVWYESSHLPNKRRILQFNSEYKIEPCGEFLSLECTKLPKASLYSYDKKIMIETHLSSDSNFGTATLSKVTFIEYLKQNKMNYVLWFSVKFNHGDIMLDDILYDDDNYITCKEVKPDEIEITGKRFFKYTDL